MSSAAVLPGRLPSGRLSRDPAWASILREAWEADPEISALPGCGAELGEFTELEYEHRRVRLCGLLLAREPGVAPRSQPSADADQRQRQPGVLLAHTGAGPRDLYLLWRASSLAARGYVALVVDLFGDHDGSAWEAPFSRARMDELRSDRSLLGGRMDAALRALRADPRVDSERCAAVGWCLGGRAALDLARGGADLRAAVSFHGVLDAVPAELLAPAVSARLLICDGELDPLQTDEARAAMRAQLRGVGADFELLSFSRACHGFTCPAQRLSTADGFGYEPRAAARSWEAARTFLHESLA